MGKLTKRFASILNMKKHQALFSCPICKNEMIVQEDGYILCHKKHSFDIAKQGYVNFMVRPSPTMYDKSLFASRKTVIESGLYDVLQETIADRIGKQRVSTILDTGCGEGSHLEKISERLEQDIISVGIDISKEGIQAAAKYYEQKIWIVSDLANSPFKEESFDIILNILSPANYEEFHRILKPNGKVFKVVPGQDYLKEIRKHAFANTEKESYSNDETVARFEEQFKKVTRDRITYTRPLDAEQLPNLLEMTPLGWHLEKDIQIEEITIDLEILVGENS